MLEVQDIAAGYGGARAISEMSFEVGEGETLALLGRNGAGKTTTLKTIMGLLRPTHGEITFNGQNIVGWGSDSIARAGIGYVPEDRRVFSGLNVLENLETACKPNPNQQMSWTTNMLFDLFPEIARRRNAQAGTLSGGEQQMLSIARAMMGNPTLLLLDEPSEGLAPVVVKRLGDVLLELKRQGTSMVISEQNQHLARKVSKDVIIIETGTPAYVGNFTGLDNDPSITQQLLGV